MKNTFGNNIAVTIFGESHGPYVGAVIDGLPAGIVVDETIMADHLSKRRPAGATDTPRVEKDEFQIISGVFEGKTSGSPLTVIIPNSNTRSGDYERGLPRPSHADFSAYSKYFGYEDYRGGGHFSGRITAALVAVGGILIPELERKGIKIGTHILNCHGVEDRAFSDIEKDLDGLKSKTFPVLEESVRKKMEDEIIAAREDNDSVGGIIQTAVTGMPAGVGQPWFDSFESELSHAIFSIGGIKGIEFGLGFDFADKKGSECNDAIRMFGEKVVTVSNNNGGINGGISNGMPIIFNMAVKPTPSIGKEQDSVDLKKGENATLSINGRHDPAIIRRICPVVNSVTAIAVADMLMARYGEEKWHELG